MIKARWVNGHAIPVEDVNWLEWYDSLEPLVFEPGEEEEIVSTVWLQSPGRPQTAAGFRITMPRS
jgi:hypothetical protein